MNKVTLNILGVDMIENLDILNLDIGNNLNEEFLFSKLNQEILQFIKDYGFRIRLASSYGPIDLFVTDKAEHFFNFCTDDTMPVTTDIGAVVSQRTITNMLYYAVCEDGRKYLVKNDLFYSLAGEDTEKLEHLIDGIVGVYDLEKIPNEDKIKFIQKYGPDGDPEFDIRHASAEGLEVLTKTIQHNKFLRGAPMEKVFVKGSKHYNIAETILKKMGSDVKLKECTAFEGKTFYLLEHGTHVSIIAKEVSSIYHPSASSIDFDYLFLKLGLENDAKKIICTIDKIM